MAIKKWKTLSEEDVSPDKWFPVYKHKVELANGKIIDDFYVGDFGQCVLIVPILKTGEMVLVKQYRQAVQDTLIEFPEGREKAGKDGKTTACEELLEETGIEVAPSRMEKVAVFAPEPSKMIYKVHLYLARNLDFNASQKLDPEEEIEILTFKPKDLLRKIKEGEIWSSNTVAATLQVFLMYPEIFK
ncbi:MAG: NUDIX hydrolase [Candidatus Dojkabacteria bacterium]